MIVVSVAAQNADTLEYRSQSVRSVGIGFPAVNYSYLSPLNHSGLSVGFQSVRFREKPEHFTQFRMHSKLGILYNNANDSYITMLGISSGFSRHRNKADRSRRFQLTFGGSGDIGVDIYMKEDNTNNPLAYFFSLSVSPSVLLQHQFKTQNAHVVFRQQIDVPLFSLISSSGYSTALPYPFVEPEASFFDAMRLASFGSLRKCVTFTTFDVTPLHERQHKWPVFRISYLFSGMRYKKDDFTVKSADHLILFGAIFYLFR